MNSSKRTYEVGNVTEAISLAKQFLENGEYNLFRGQSQNWPMEPTMRRLSVSARKAETDKFKRLAYWAINSPPLRTMAEDVVKLTAVAQHYGIATTYLDFSTNPLIAGFFASHVGNPASFRPSLDSCIICINSKAFKELEPATAFEVSPKLIQIDVQNLWRLQAQSGLFVHVPERGRPLEEMIPCTRILFPYDGPVLVPTENDVYPTRKSQLEIILNEYFMNEALIESQPRLLEFFEKVVYVSDGTWQHEKSEFKDGHIPPVLDSWSENSRKAWDVHKDERFEDVRSELALSITIPTRDLPEVVIEATTNAVLQELSRNPAARQRIAKWSVCDESGQELRYCHQTHEGDVFLEAARKVEWLWDGLRSIPYSDAQVAQAIANYLALVAWESNTKQYTGESFEACWGETAFLELGRATGASQRAFCSAVALWDCTRADLREFFMDVAWTRVQSDVTELLALIIAPDRTFEFETLTDLFSRQIVPSQMHLARYGDSSDPVFFSPAQIQALGSG